MMSLSKKMIKLNEAYSKKEITFLGILETILVVIITMS